MVTKAFSKGRKGKEVTKVGFSKRKGKEESVKKRFSKGRGGKGKKRIHGGASG